MELVQHTDQKLLRVLLRPLAESWVPLPKDRMETLRGNAGRLSKPHVGYQTAKGSRSLAIAPWESKRKLQVKCKKMVAPPANQSISLEISAGTIRGCHLL